MPHVAQDEQHAQDDHDVQSDHLAECVPALNRRIIHNLGDLGRGFRGFAFCASPNPIGGATGLPGLRNFNCGTVLSSLANASDYLFPRPGGTDFEDYTIQRDQIAQDDQRAQDDQLAQTVGEDRMTLPITQRGKIVRGTDHLNTARSTARHEWFEAPVDFLRNLLVGERGAPTAFSEILGRIPGGPTIYLTIPMRSGYSVFNKLSLRQSLP